MQVVGLFGFVGFGLVLVLVDRLECRPDFLPARARVAPAQADARPGHDGIAGRAGTATMAFHH